MPSKPTTARRKLSSELHAAIFALRDGGASNGEIAKQMNLARSTVTTIIHRTVKQQKASSLSTKCIGRPPKPNDREKRAFVRHIERNPHDNLTTPSKSGH